MTPVTLTLDQAIAALAPVVVDVVKALRERLGAEPSLDQLHAELATADSRARLEAEAFYLHHPEQRPS